MPPLIFAYLRSARVIGPLPASHPTTASGSRTKHTRNGKKRLNLAGSFTLARSLSAFPFSPFVKAAETRHPPT
ncbi:MAG: hypothetical protein CVU39_06265 [Chloroflexi bacterium HGW-Chloroflexi-10]|nr:MAG: hypothetical protein CVU39_06265 [Chloroflexi bacterium HGW-Chloroflexi-10]